MGKVAFIFPGQGAQKVGMGKEFYDEFESAKNIFDLATKTVNIDMKALCFEENENINITEYTQVALLTTSIAMLTVLEEKGFKPDITAGLSLGEYCALVASGVLKIEDAIRLIRKRGILMQNAVPVGEGAMAAILSLDNEKIEAVLEAIPDVEIANYNCPGQTVISGKIEAVKTANEKLLEAGAKRAIMLNVSGPFHSKMLKEAGKELGEELKNVDLGEVKIPYVTNVTGETITDTSNIKALLEKQVYSSVYWQQSVENMIAAGVDTFIEIGPGRTLTGFVKKISRAVKTYNIEKPSDIEKLSELL